MQGSKRPRVDDPEAEAEEEPCCSHRKLKEKLLDNLENYFECVICKDWVVRTRALVPCGHIACQDCLAQWLKRSNSCPVCRHVTKKQVPVRSIDGLLEEVLVPLLDPSEKDLFTKRLRQKGAAKGTEAKGQSEAIVIPDEDENHPQPQQPDRTRARREEPNEHVLNQIFYYIPHLNSWSARR